MKTTATVAVTNIIAYIATVLAAWPIFFGFDQLFEPALGGSVGALCRCVVEWRNGALSQRSAIANSLVGVGMALVLFKLQVPFLDGILGDGPLIGNRERGFLWGAFGVLIWGLVDDLLRRKKGEP